MDGYVRADVRKFNRAITLFHRAGKTRSAEAAKSAIRLFEELHIEKYTEMAKELYYEIRGTEQKGRE